MPYSRVASFFDFICSSHWLEEFGVTRSILVEWPRVLKPCGNLVLFYHDEQPYRKRCQETGQPYNHRHKQENCSLSGVKAGFG